MGDGRSLGFEVVVGVALVCCVYGFFGNPVHLSSQTAEIQGLVLDDSTEVGISGAEVQLLSPRGAILRRTHADEAGVFYFRVPTAGYYRLQAERIGYQAARSPSFEVEIDGSVSVEIRLRVDAVLLAPLEIVGRSSAATNPTLSGFYERKARGTSGYFFSRDDIANRNASRVVDIIRMAPGVRVEAGRRGGGWSVYMSRALRIGGSCPAQVFVDGILMNRRIASVQRLSDGQPISVDWEEDRDFTIDELVSPHIVEGIEVYNGLSGVPAPYVNADSRCGVVLIWTRRGH